MNDGRQDIGRVGGTPDLRGPPPGGQCRFHDCPRPRHVNGIDSGIYVMREPINRDFPTRNFGPFSDANLYELSYHHDPMLSPRQIALLERLVEVGRILASAPQTTRTAADVKKFTDYRPVIEAFTDNGGTTTSVAGLP